MSKALNNEEESLNISSNNIAEVANELMKKEEDLRKNITMSLAKMKQYEIRELRLANNNYKLGLQLNNYRIANEAIVNAITEKTESIEQINRTIDVDGKENEIERKTTWEYVQNKLAFYGRAMVNAQDEYKSINLRNDIDFYKKTAVGVTEEIHHLNNEIEAIKQKFESHPSVSQLTDVQAVIDMLNGEEDTLLRAIRAEENMYLELSRQLKQLKMEISKLHKK